MSPAEVEVIAVRTTALLMERLVVAGVIAAPLSPVLTLEEAKAMAKKRSDRAFYRFDHQHGPTSCGHGRYSRERVLRALDREARK